jgi:hypothetical protein
MSKFNLTKFFHLRPPSDEKLGELGTLPSDGIPWRYPKATPRIMAVGDLHGDLSALASLLHGAKFVDDLGNWIGENSQLVLMGDMIGGNSDSRLLLDFLMRLERESRRAGGDIHPILGNHDLLAIQGEKKTSDLFRGDSSYAVWLRKCNTCLVIGDQLFIHAGLGPWAEHVDLERVNSTVRAWIRFWQGVGEKPAKNTRWTVGKRDMRRGSKWESGPLWNRSYKVKVKGKKILHKPLGDSLTPLALESILAKLGLQRLVIGHSPVDTGEVLLEHPVYGKRVIMTDTRISESDGELSAVIFEGDSTRAMRAESRKQGIRIRDEEKQRLSTHEVEVSGWRRMIYWFRNP